MAPAPGRVVPPERFALLSSPPDTAASPSPTPARPPSVVRLATELCKLRLVTLVVGTAVAGYLLADGGNGDGLRLVGMAVGTALAAAGAQALNQRLEMHRDARMERTRTRPLPAGLVAPATATVVGVTAAVLGVATLAGAAGPLPALLAAAVVALYTFIYTPLKPRTSANTLVGAVCGAIPPMIGWTAARGDVGVGAWLLFGVLFLWQIPHFLALAWLYRADYARGGFRMLPADDPDGQLTGLATVLYTAALAPLVVAGALYGITGWLAATGGTAMVAWLLLQALRMAKLRSDASARRLFVATLVVLPLLLGLMVVDRNHAGPVPEVAVTAGLPAFP